jgi:hypothetical protein
VTASVIGLLHRTALLSSADVTGDPFGHHDRRQVGRCRRDLRKDRRVDDASAPPTMMTS